MSTVDNASIDGGSRIVTPGMVVGSTVDGTPGAGCYVLESSTKIRAAITGIGKTSKAEDSGKLVLSVSPVKPSSRLPAVGDLVTCRVSKINARMASVDILAVHAHQDKDGSSSSATATNAATTAAAASNVIAASPSPAASVLSSPSSSSSSSDASNPPLSTFLLDESLVGSIRQRDVRSFDIDSVEMYKCFRPMDLVRAQVLSLGDARSYFLTTARNDLGVILAHSNTSGATMTPINWEQMACPITGEKEFRKVAKIEV